MAKLFLSEVFWGQFVKMTGNIYQYRSHNLKTSIMFWIINFCKKTGKDLQIQKKALLLHSQLRNCTMVW